MAIIDPAIQSEFEAMAKVHCRHVHLGQDRDGTYMSSYTRDLLALFIATRRRYLAPQPTNQQDKETT